MRLFKKMMAALAASLLLMSAADAAPNQKVGVVKFKTCVEKSKMGQREHSAFEDMKKEAAKMVEGKEKELTAISAKLQDQDYMETLKPEAEAELKHKFRALSQEMGAFQNRFYQEMQQAQYRIFQHISEYVAEASKKVASQQNLDMVVNEDNCFFYTPSLDITEKVIAVMDKAFEEKQKGA